MSAPPFAITEALIRQHAAAESFERGRAYQRQGAVGELMRRDNVLEADVEGSEPLPYRVRVQFDAAGVTEATCTCPYDWGGWRKHVVATLLTYLSAPDTVEERPEPAALLRDLDRDRLEAIILRLIEREPALADVVEGEVNAISATPAAASTAATRRTPVDTASYRRQVRAATRGAGVRYGLDAYYAMSGAVGGVRQVLEQAWTFIRSGDGQNALPILEVITDEFLAGYEELDDSDGEGGDLFTAIGEAWTEAVLDPDVTAAERRGWRAKLEGWQDAIAQYGMDEAFLAAMQAAEEGWEDARVRRLLRGEMPDGDAVADDDDDETGGALLTARLNVLERQGRQQEFLRLAAAAGRADRYAAMLIQLGRIEEAVAHAVARLETAAESLALAQLLRERGRLAEALQVGERGLTLEGDKAQLAAWVRDLAAGMGERERALAAARVALRQEISLANYQRTQELAGDGWPGLRAKVLDEIRRARSYYPRGQLDIFLHEGLLEDAMRAVEGGATHSLVEQVVDAVLTSHPDWAIRMSRAQAEPIMDEGRAQYYDAAANWLAKARAAYRAAGRADEWQTYREELLDVHHRKYKLRPLIEALGP